MLVVGDVKDMSTDVYRYRPGPHNFFPVFG